MSKDRMTTRQTAETSGISMQRVNAKVIAGHYPGHGLCECGQTIMIPVKSVLADLAAGRTKAGRPRKSTS